MERSNFEFEHDYVQERIENMASEDLMTLIIVFVLAVAFGVLSACSFMEKGYLLNNQYLNASKEERESMDKRPYYRQSAICFLLCSIMFFICGILMLAGREDLIVITVVPLAIITVLYAVVSYIKINY